MISRVFIRTSISHVVKGLRLTSASKENICLKNLICLNEVLVYAKTICIFNKIDPFCKKKIHLVGLEIMLKRSF